MTSKNASRSSRSTVGTATEVADYLRLLFAKIGHVFCRNCGQEVRRDTPQSTAEWLATLPPGKRFMVAFAQDLPEGTDRAAALAALREEGFIRVIVDGRMVNLDEPGDGTAGRHGRLVQPAFPCTARSRRGTCAAATAPPEPALRDSLDTALPSGQGKRGSASRFVENGGCQRDKDRLVFAFAGIDGGWRRLGFSAQLACEDCGIEYPPPEPRLYSFNSPLGACPECEGFGNVIGMDMDLVVPDASKSLAGGAIAPWNSPAYVHELEELLALAADYDLPVDVPFSQLTRAAAGVDCARRAGAEVRRPGGLFRLAGAAEVQDAHPRVPQPLAELSALPGLRRLAAAAGGPGRPDRRAEYRRAFGHEGPRRRRSSSAPCRCPSGSKPSAG